MDLNSLPDEDEFLGASQYLEYLKEKNPGALITTLADSLDDHLANLRHYNNLMKELQEDGHIKQVNFVSDVGVYSSYWYWADVPDEKAFEAILERSPSKPHPVQPFRKDCPPLDDL